MDSVQNASGKQTSGLLKALLLVVFGLAVNLFFSKLTSWLELPLYIDNVGIILTSALGGYIPGVAVGYITNAINGISDSSSYYYGTISVMNAVIAAYGAHRGWFRRFPKIILSIILFTITGGVLGSILTWLLYGFDPEYAKPIASSFYENGLSPFWAQFCSDVIYDLIDKTITVLLVLIFLYIIRILLKVKRIEFSFWHQNVLSDEEIRNIKKTRTSRMSLRSKLLFLLSGIMIFIALVTMGISYLLFREKLIDSNIDMGMGITNITAATIDPDRIDDYISMGRNDPEYQLILNQMERIAGSHGDIKYVYVVRIVPNGYEAIFDADIGDENLWQPGQIIPFQEEFRPYITEALRGEEVPAMIIDDDYGWLLTLYKPVYNKDGNCVYYSCVDILMSHLQEDENRFLAKVIALFIGFFILVLVVFLWLTDYCVIYPINTMALAAKNMAFNLKGAEKEGAANISRLGIRTGDEIETLYLALKKTSDDIVQQVSDIEEQKDTINKMQNALITVLANMVENRDKFTGNHVKNTASYAKIILDRLKLDEKYKDLITDDYEYTVINSAPLHDVGKIQIPDALLNKNGKLTDEEFKQMQNHTLAGQHIIDEAASMVKDSSYLGEARNLAAYHHEKWNGTGYPYGLKENEIPLSARIMAVADVFDALVSRRSYKPGFPVEKALEIIREGAGTHFDPDITKVFLEAEEEVKRIARANYERDNPDEVKTESSDSKTEDTKMDSMKTGGTKSDGSK